MVSGWGRQRKPLAWGGRACCGGPSGRGGWPGQSGGRGSGGQEGTAEHAQRANRRDFVGNARNAVVVTAWQGHAYAAGDEKVCLTSLPVAAPLAVLDRYDPRSLIENTAFSELEPGRGLKHYPKKTEAAVRGHVFLTRVTFTLANAFRTAAGQAPAAHGIRRQCAEAERAKVLVFADAYSAIFDIEAVFILLGVTPQPCRSADPARVRRGYGLPATASRPRPDPYGAISATVL